MRAGLLAAPATSVNRRGSPRRRPTGSRRLLGQATAYTVATGPARIKGGAMTGGGGPFRGIYPILYAFFDATGGLDREAMRRQAEACVRGGAHRGAALGLVTGGGKLSFAGRHARVAWVVRGVAGRLPGA